MVFVFPFAIAFGVVATAANDFGVDSVSDGVVVTSADFVAREESKRMLPTFQSSHASSPFGVALSNALTVSSKVPGVDVCKVGEDILQLAVKNQCKSEKDVTCVFLDFPKCQIDDICSWNKPGCGYVVDNSFVKFSGYSCSGDMKVGPAGELIGNFKIDCSPTLTPMAVLVIVICSVCVLGCLCGGTWLCCCRRPRSS
jgi:hypothetical protein